MSSSRMEPLAEMKSLVNTLGMMQTLEGLFLNADQMQDSNDNLEERVRSLEVLKWQMKWFNTERLSILQQLRQTLFHQISVEQRNASAMRQGIVELRQGLNGLNNRINTMSEDCNCPICLCPWTSQGNHRVVSLRCGHLFGSSCVRTAIRRFHRCPICRRRAQHSDVRRIFSRRFFP
ncbi:E3 ubiquitin-protein ligase RFWD3 [Drosophila subpulchrella]|uniref:E3 ubiquitin-protein ligase RFWD3 n=1 Tax=Drosophila subpulchrella TaxID=1486046 RepID=UPI0018A1A5E5|nr:E3 ubiquitin-protein ligase RFWD3 [Drosophila subpulchrella]